MLLDSANNGFNLQFNKSFIPEKTTMKWQPYVDRIGGNIYRNLIDVVNYSIQSVNINDVSQDAVEQTQNDGTVRKYRTTQPVRNLVEREFTVQFKMLEGFFNYFVLRDAFFEHYSFENTKPFLDDIFIRIYNISGIETTQIVFEKPIMTSVSGLELNYSNNVAEFQTFDVGFVCNGLNFKTTDF